MPLRLFLFWDDTGMMWAVHFCHHWHQSCKGHQGASMGKCFSAAPRPVARTVMARPEPAIPRQEATLTPRTSLLTPKVPHPLYQRTRHRNYNHHHCCCQQLTTCPWSSSSISNGSHRSSERVQNGHPQWTDGVPRQSKSDFSESKVNRLFERYGTVLRVLFLLMAWRDSARSAGQSSRVHRPGSGLEVPGLSNVPLHQGGVCEWLPCLRADSIKGIMNKFGSQEEVKKLPSRTCIASPSILGWRGGRAAFSALRHGCASWASPSGRLRPGRWCDFLLINRSVPLTWHLADVPELHWGHWWRPEQLWRQWGMASLLMTLSSMKMSK